MRENRLYPNSHEIKPYHPTNTMDQRENSSASIDLQNRRELERDLHNKPIKGDREVARPMEELIVRVVEGMERLPAHVKGVEAQIWKTFSS
ncbi:hypothetical protein QJS10_CPA07g00447 [Acorus calamus]|uniref:Uncharacterized protein n=1 Tax=Acorus calamus TaxID=4465 RepID=A0AAV9EJK0_ACOCL|nr:hypothetical protein QJS10_CPA07g00447 [Acorus calamus]